MNRRIFGKLMGMGSLVGLSGRWPRLSAFRPGLPPDAPALIPWYHDKWKGVEIGNEFTNEYDALNMSRATGEDTIQKLLLANLDYVVIFMKEGPECGVFYDTKIPGKHKHKNLGSRDYLRECCEQCRKHGIRVVAYCLIQYDDTAFHDHPEWRMKQWDGKDIDGRLCYNAQGYLELVEQYAAEMMEYDISGFHFDMNDMGFNPPFGCFCPENCQPLFRQRFGKEMPRPSQPTWDEDWDKILEFRYSSNEHFCSQLREFVHAHRPEVSVDFNYHGYPPFNWHVGETPTRHSRMGDFCTAEGLPWAFGYYMPSMIAVFMAGANPGVRPQVATSRFNRSYGDYTVRSVEEMKWEIFTYLANGIFTTIVDKTNYDGSLDAETFRRIGEVYKEVDQKKEYLGHRPVRAVGLYFSLRTRDWYGREATPNYTDSIYGAHKTLVESHIPVGFLFDETISAESLQEYPVVYLANTAILSEKEISLFQDYVREGGKILATGHCGDFDRLGNPLSDFTASELLGVRLGRRLEYPDNHFRLPAAPNTAEGGFLTSGLPANVHVLTVGDALAVTPTTGRRYGELWSGIRMRDEKGNVKPYTRPMSPAENVGPAVVVNKLGSGEVIYVPFQPDGAYAGDFRMKEHRLLVRNLLRHLYSNPPFRIDAPLNVEATITHDAKGRRYVLHFVGYNSLRTINTGNSPRVLPPLMEEPLIYRAKVEVFVPFQSVRALSPKTTLKRVGTSIEFSTDEIHEAIIISL